MKSYYQIIGVDTNASADTIKNAYLLKIKKYHPDVYAGDKAFAEAKTAELNEAYEVLKDEQKRAEYDKKVKINQPNKTTLKDRWQKFKQDLKTYRQMMGLLKGKTKKEKTKPKLTKEQQQEKNDKNKLTALIFVTLIAILIILLIMLL